MNQNAGFCIGQAVMLAGLLQFAGAARSVTSHGKLQGDQVVDSMEQIKGAAGECVPTGTGKKESNRTEGAAYYVAKCSESGRLGSKSSCERFTTGCTWKSAENSCLLDKLVALVAAKKCPIKTAVEAFKQSRTKIPVSDMQKMMQTLYNQAILSTSIDDWPSTLMHKKQFVPVLTQLTGGEEDEERIASLFKTGEEINLLQLLQWSSAQEQFDEFGQTFVAMLDHINEEKNPSPNDSPNGAQILSKPAQTTMSVGDIVMGFEFIQKSIEMSLFVVPAIQKGIEPQVAIVMFMQDAKKMAAIKVQSAELARLVLSFRTGNGDVDVDEFVEMMTAMKHQPCLADHVAGKSSLLADTDATEEVQTLSWLGTATRAWKMRKENTGTNQAADHPPEHKSIVDAH